MKNGFILIELLVSILIFVLIISVTIGIFVSIVRYQKKVLVEQELLNQTSYVLEYMSRALRMAKRDSEGSCLGGGYSECSYRSIHDGGGIKFINHLENDICQEFFWDKNDNLLKESKRGQTFPLISDKFQINSLRFNLSGESQIDNLQPRVTIFMEIQVKRGENQPKLKIQTTISQRNLDVP